MVVRQVSFYSPVLPFEKSVKHNIEILSGRGSLGELFVRVMKASSEYGELRVLGGIVNQHGEILDISYECKTVSKGTFLVSFLVDNRTADLTVDVIIPSELDPEARAVLWETTKRLRVPLKAAA